MRGRGASNELAGPFGLASHAADCARVLEEAGSGPAVVVGESMGGYVAVLLAAARPDLVARLVLVDGGIPLPLPDGVDPATLAEAVLGPALARLSMIFESRPAYLEFWRAHPAMGEDWNAYVEAYLDYDLEETAGGFRSRVSEEAVRADSTQTLLDADDIEKALASLTCPIHLIRAPRNLLNQPTPLIPDEAVADWRTRLAQLEVEMVDDTNHYTVMFGARGAAVIGRAVKAAP
jgi:pimeloyl-ACP methyl ester carboxylesterase